MKRAIRWGWLVVLAAIMTTVLPPAWGVTLAAPDAAAQTVNAGYLENVTFERLPGKERVTLAVSKQSGVKVENLPGNAVQVSMENLFVPEGLRRPLSDAALANVVRVTPVQKTAEGRSWVIATIDLKQKVPYSVRQDGMNIVIDFNVTSVAAAEPAPEKPLPVAQTPEARPADKSATPGGAATKDVAGDAGKDKKVNGGPLMSIDVQDADINKVVFSLLAELGKVSIVASDDVKGPVTLKMKDVSWEQVLETILGLKGLAQTREGNVITVLTLDKMKKGKEERMALEKARKAEADQLKPREDLITRVVPIAYNDLEELKKNIQDLQKETKDKDKDAKDDKDSKTASSPGSVTVDKHTRSLIIKDTPREMAGLLRFIESVDKPTTQILIKANIIETTKDTARNLGIQWGGMWGQKIGSQGLYVTPGGTGGSTTPPGSAFSGGYTTAAGGAKGVAGQGFGVNFPAAMAGTASGSLGLIFGAIGENILELQLNALQKDGKLNILSSPSIITLNNKKAITENGEEIPYVIPGTGSSVPTIQKTPAKLTLEITPNVVDGKNIKMDILVIKDEVDFSRQVQGNPVIITKKTETNSMVADGETIVISGLTKQKKQDSINGIPWLKDIPVLGWLFKGEGTSDSMEEVLIFITPTIIKPQTVAGIQDGA